MHVTKLNEQKEIHLSPFKISSLSSKKTNNLSKFLFDPLTRIDRTSSLASYQEFSEKITHPIPFSLEDVQDIAHLLGYQDEEEIQAGLTCKAIESFLVGEMDNFTTQLAKIKLILIKAKEEGYDIKRAAEEVDEKKLDAFKIAVETHFSPSFFEDLLAFFQDIHLCQQTFADKAFFHDENTLLHSSNEATFSENNEKATGVKRFTGLYSKENLSSYFTSLQKELATNSEENSLAFKLTFQDKSLSIGYIVAKNCWFFIDPDTLRMQEIQDTQLLVETIFSSFKVEEAPLLLLSTEVYSTKKDKKLFQKLLTKWQTSIDYKKIHCVTPEKAQLILTNHKTSWLNIASKLGDTQAVELLIKANANVNHFDSNGGTPLLLASNNGHLDVVKLLLAAGADANQAGPTKGLSPLIVATLHGYSDIVRLLLEAQADVNQADFKGFTPLLLASYYGHSDIVKLLLEGAADINQANSDGWSPLLVASVKGYTDIVKLLLEAGANVNQATPDGRNSLMLASKYGHLDIIQLLYRQGAIRKLSHIDLTNISSALGYKNTEGLCHGIAHKGLEAFLIQDMDTFKGRLQKINELAQKLDESNQTLSILAEDQTKESSLWLEQFIKTIYPELLIDLLAFLDGVQIHQQANVYPQIFTKNQRPLLCQAHLDRIKAISPFTDSLQLESLGGLEKISLFNGVYTEEKLTLYFESFKQAVKESSLQSMVAFQISCITHSISVGYNPIDEAWTFIDANFPNDIENICDDKLIAKKVFSAFKERIEEANIALSTRIYCLSKTKDRVKETYDVWKNTSVFQEIHAVTVESTNPEANNLLNFSWLNIAAQSGDVEKIQSLLKTPVNVNAFTLNTATPLFLAVWNGHTEAVDALLNAQADPELTNHHWTALSHAAYNGYEKIAKLLLQANANVNHKDSEGVTPLMVASYYGYPEVVNLFLTSNADVNAVDSSGETASTLAASKGEFETLKILMNHKLSKIFERTLKTTPSCLAY